MAKTKQVIPSILKVVASGIKLMSPQIAKSKAMVLMEETIDRVNKMTADNSDVSASDVAKEVIKSGVGVMGSAIPKLSFDEGREYTKKQAIKHIIATEEHFRSGLCSACLLEKHLPALEMYADEGLSYCIDGECEAYSELQELVRQVEYELKRGVPSKARQIEIAEKFRNIRKRLSGYDELSKEIDKELGEGDQEANTLRNE